MYEHKHSTPLAESLFPAAMEITAPSSYSHIGAWCIVVQDLGLGVVDLKDKAAVEVAEREVGDACSVGQQGIGPEESGSLLETLLQQQRQSEADAKGFDLKLPSQMQDNGAAIASANKPIIEEL